MAYSESEPSEKKVFRYRVCWHCKKIMHWDRKYCGNCGSDLCHDGNGYTPIHQTENDLKLKKPNIDDQQYSCEKCRANCDYCASFSYSTKNERGYGGKDCEHKYDTIRCTCCQLIIKKLSQDADFNKCMKEVFESIENIRRRRAA